MHIVDVTDPENTVVTGKYTDPNTQVLDVKYIEYNGREYIVQQNQLIDPGYADPNVGEWSDPAQVSVTLIDVTDKETQLGLIHGMMSTTQAAPTIYTLT